MGNTSVQDMHSGYAVFDGVDAVVELRKHTAADVAIFDKLSCLFYMKLGNQGRRILRISADALDISQECQLLRMDGPGNLPGSLCYGKRGQR